MHTREQEFENPNAILFIVHGFTSHCGRPGYDVMHFSCLKITLKRVFQIVCENLYQA